MKWLRVALAAPDLAVVATATIGFAIWATFGLRPSNEFERQGFYVTYNG